LIFLDANVLVYAAGLHGEKDPRTEVARTIVRSGERFAISLQVLQEFDVRARRDQTLSPETTLGFVVEWRTFHVEPLTIELFDQALKIQDRYRFHYWDCAIIAAAQLAGCDTLLSEDMQHNQVIGDLRVLNPFADAS